MPAIRRAPRDERREQAPAICGRHKGRLYKAPADNRQLVRTRANALAARRALVFASSGGRSSAASRHKGSGVGHIHGSSHPHPRRPLTLFLDETPRLMPTATSVSATIRSHEKRLRRTSTFVINSESRRHGTLSRSRSLVIFDEDDGDEDLLDRLGFTWTAPTKRDSRADRPPTLPLRFSDSSGPTPTRPAPPPPSIPSNMAVKKRNHLPQPTPPAALSPKLSTETIRAAPLARSLTRTKTLLADDFQRMDIRGAPPVDAATQPASSVIFPELDAPTRHNTVEQLVDPLPPPDRTAPHAESVEDVALISILHPSDSPNHIEFDEPLKHVTVWNMAPDANLTIKGIVHARPLPASFAGAGVPKVENVMLYLQTYHANANPAARLVKETPARPSYYDYADVGGRNRRPDSQIRVELGQDAVRAARQALCVQGGGGVQLARDTAAFEVGIPLHLLHRKEAKFFRITATITYALKLGSPSVVCESKPYDFSISNLHFVERVRPQPRLPKCQRVPKR